MNYLGLKSEASLLRHAWVVFLILDVQFDSILGHATDAFGEVAHRRSRLVCGISGSRPGGIADDTENAVRGNDVGLSSYPKHPKLLPRTQDFVSAPGSLTPTG